MANVDEEKITSSCADETIAFHLLCGQNNQSMYRLHLLTQKDSSNGFSLHQIVESVLREHEE